ADDVEGVVGRDQHVAPHGAANQLNGRSRKAGEIPEGLVLDLAVLAIGPTQEVIAIVAAPVRARDLSDVTGPGSARHTADSTRRAGGKSRNILATYFLATSASTRGTSPHDTAINLGYEHGPVPTVFRHCDADLRRVWAGELRSKNMGGLDGPPNPPALGGAPAQPGPPSTL